MKDNCRKYSISKYNADIKHGSLTLAIIDSNHYSIKEIIKKGTGPFLEHEKHVREFGKARRLERKHELDFTKRGLVNEQTSKFAFRKLNLAFPTSGDLYSWEEGIRIEHPTMSDYRKRTTVVFHLIKTGDFNEVKVAWEQHKTNSNLRYRHSLYSESEYLEDHAEGIVYRLSNNWFFRGSSNWDIEGVDPEAVPCFSIDMAKLAEFNREKNYWYENLNPQNVTECKKNMQKNKEKIDSFLADKNLTFSEAAKEKFQMMSCLSAEIILALDTDILRARTLLDEFRYKRT